MEEETIFCMYCKAVLTDKSEKELGYHHSCNDIIKNEKNLTLNEIFSRFRILTHGNFKIIDSEFEHETSEIIDFDFMNFLQKDTLYVNQTQSKKFLYLYLTNLTIFPFELSYFSDLLGLKISNNSALTLNENVNFLTNLIALDLEFYDYIHGLEFIKDLKKIVYLRLAGPLPENFQFPTTFSELNKLQIVKLESFNCLNLIEFLANLPSIKDITLTVGIINEPFTKMDSLESAYFNNVRFNYDFSSLFISRNLRKLTFSTCFIERLPEFNPALSKLENLVIHNVPLTELRISLSKVSSLKTLELKSTKLQEIPYEFENLTSLNLDKSLINEINPKIEKLKNLVSLSITNSQLKNINENIPKLKNLKVLILSGTGISKIPGDVGALQKLELINLSNNDIKAFPMEILLLKNLKVLILDKNGPFENFPNELIELTKLEQLSLKLVEMTYSQKRFLADLQNENLNLHVSFY